MNDQSQHITHYSAADIQRYLGGNMSASEMHAIEKAALDDPFLADAIEGYDAALQSHGATPVNTGLDELKAAMAEKVQPASGKLRSMVWWKYVAAAVVVIVAGMYLWNNNYSSKDVASNQAQPVVALKETDTQANTAPAPDSAKQSAPAVSGNETLHSFRTADAEKMDRNANKDQHQESVAATADQVPPPQAKSIQGRSIFNNSVAIQPKANEKQIPLDTNVPATVVPDGFAKKEIILNTEKTQNQFNFSDTVGRPVRTEIVGALQGHVPALVTQSNADNKKLSNVIRGRVVDQLEKPIANAFLRTQESDEAMNKTYFTDRNGFFNIPTPVADSSALKRLNFSVTAAGFNTQQARFNSFSNNNVQLTPDNAAQENVVVSAYGKYKSNVTKKIRETDILQQNAEPVDGWLKYETYLRSNNKLISATSDSSRAVRDVVVSFVVGRRGELSDFNITSGSTSEANAEAIRLIKEGPAWKVKRGRKATASVIVHF